jgi:hypothetical protein
MGTFEGITAPTYKAPKFDWREIAGRRLGRILELRRHLVAEQNRAKFWRDARLQELIRPETLPEYTRWLRREREDAKLYIADLEAERDDLRKRLTDAVHQLNQVKSSHAAMCAELIDTLRSKV